MKSMLGFNILQENISTHETRFGSFRFQVSSLSKKERRCVNVNILRKGKKCMRNIKERFRDLLWSGWVVSDLLACEFFVALRIGALAEKIDG
jgi:hypothetical protein